MTDVRNVKNRPIDRNKAYSFFPLPAAIFIFMIYHEGDGDGTVTVTVTWKKDTVLDFGGR